MSGKPIFTRKEKLAFTCKERLTFIKKEEKATFTWKERLKDEKGGKKLLIVNNTN